MHQSVSVLSDPNVDVLEIGDRMIVLVGTAHVSEVSAKLAQDVITTFAPDAVAIELCEGRYRSLKNPDRWKETDLVSAIREGKSYVLLMQIMLAAFQRKLGSALKIRPGAEMLRAAETAEQIGAQVVPVDREIKITLKRAWSSLSFAGMFKLFGVAIVGGFKGESLTSEEIERLKSADALEELMRDFSANLPEIRTALIDERDRYLAAKIRAIPSNRIVAVLGAAHVAGVKNWITQDDDITPLEKLPPESIAKKLTKWVVPFLIVASVIAVAFTGGSDKSGEMMLSWFVITALSGALGAAVLFAHPLTTLAAGLSAPFTTLNPLIAAGWVAGLAEAFIRRPRVKDLETVADDISTLRGALNNRVTKTLFIMASVNLFVMGGMAIAATRVVQMLATP